MAEDLHTGYQDAAKVDRISTPLLSRVSERGLPPVDIPSPPLPAASVGNTSSSSTNNSRPAGAEAEEAPEIQILNLNRVRKHRSRPDHVFQAADPLGSGYHCCREQPGMKSASVLQGPFGDSFC